MTKFKKMLTNILDAITDELAEVLADMDAGISFDQKDAYDVMYNRVVFVQEELLEVLHDKKLDVKE